VRHVLTFILGLCILATVPPSVLRASEVPDAGSKSPSPPASAALCPPKATIRELVNKHAHRLGIDPALVHAVMHQESGFDPRAVSPKGAMGLMQLMPETALLVGVSDAFDTEQNIMGGAEYLKQCLQRFGGDLVKALAAYNAGPLNVEKYDGCPPFAETRNYVARVMEAYTGQAPWTAGGIVRSPSPATRLSPAALAVLLELHPHRYSSTGQIIADRTGKPVSKIKPRVSPAALAVLKELYPYRNHRSEDSVVHRPAGAGKNHASRSDRSYTRMTP